ncbi:MAG: MmgE/PrpD family protein [Candidatus Methylomirabilota bacterium]
MSYTSDLAHYVAGLRYEVLPPATIAAAKRVTLDLLGVTLAAAPYPVARIITQYVRELGGNGRATVIGTDIRTSPPNAALANGTMAADMEVDDVHPSSNLHASSVFVPALLAVAEAYGATGKQWITALVGAYDVGCRLSRAMGDGNQYARGFHPTAVSGTFGAAAGAAKLLGLDVGGIVSALGLTGCQAAGLLTWRQEQEHFTKSFQSGVPARNAVVAVELAARGYVGAADTLDGQSNVFDAFSSRRNFPALIEGLGSRFEIEHTGFKFYSCCRDIHAPLDALFDLSRQHGLTADAIDCITVWLPDTMIPIIDNERRAARDVKELAARVKLFPDAELESRYPEHWGAKVRVRMKDGREFEAAGIDPRGTDAVPVSDAEIAAKFREMVITVLPVEQAEQMLEAVGRLETLPSMAPLIQLTAPTSSRI